MQNESPVTFNFAFPSRLTCAKRLTTERADTSGSFRLNITAEFENDEETAFEGYAGVCLEDENGVSVLI